MTDISCDTDRIHVSSGGNFKLDSAQRGSYKLKGRANVKQRTGNLGACCINVYAYTSYLATTFLFLTTRERPSLCFGLTLRSASATNDGITGLLACV